MVNQRGKGMTVFAYLSRPTLIVFGQDVCADIIDIFSFSDICIKCETEFQIFCIFSTKWILWLNYKWEVTFRKSLQRSDITRLNIHDFPQSSGKVIWPNIYVWDFINMNKVPITFSKRSIKAFKSEANQITQFTACFCFFRSSTGQPSASFDGGTLSLLVKHSVL